MISNILHSFITVLIAISGLDQQFLDYFVLVALLIQQAKQAIGIIGADINGVHNTAVGLAAVAAQVEAAALAKVVEESKAAAVPKPAALAVAVALVRGILRLIAFPEANAHQLVLTAITASGEQLKSHTAGNSKAIGAVARDCIVLDILIAELLLSSTADTPPCPLFRCRSSQNPRRRTEPLR